MKTKDALFITFFFSSIILHAQTCCSGGIPLSNNLGLAITERGTIQIGLNYDYNNLDILKNGTDNLNDNSRLRTTHSVLLNAAYSFSDNLSVEALFTWVNQQRTITQFGNENSDKTDGIGDAVVLMKYDFPLLLGTNSAFNLGLGTKIPLGSTTETNKLGILLNSDLQPGSNAWDIIYYSMFSKGINSKPSFNVFSRIIYRNTGTNTTYLGNSDYKFGNEFQAFFGFTDQFILFNTLSNPSLLIKYRNADKDKIDGFDIESTGGNWIFLIPNFSININPVITFSTRAEVPLYSNVYGTQLTPTFRFSTGILITIIQKNTVLN